jgi:hypothetical protein
VWYVAWVFLSFRVFPGNATLQRGVPIYYFTSTVTLWIVPVNRLSPSL